MWADGVFGPVIDSILFVAALALCLAVAWRQKKRMGAPRFSGAIAVYWVLVTLALPIPAYLACGVGLLLGMTSNTILGAVAGWVLSPALFCLVTMSLAAPIFTRRKIS